MGASCCGSGKRVRLVAIVFFLELATSEGTGADVWRESTYAHNRLAAALSTDCRLTNRWPGRPARVALPQSSCVMINVVSSDKRTEWLTSLWMLPSQQRTAKHFDECNVNVITTTGVTRRLSTLQNYVMTRIQKITKTLNMTTWTFATVMKNKQNKLTKDQMERMIVAVHKGCLHNNVCMILPKVHLPVPVDVIYWEPQSRMAT